MQIQRLFSPLLLACFILGINSVQADTKADPVFQDRFEEEPVASITLSATKQLLAHGETGEISVVFRDSQNNVLSGRAAVIYDESAGYLSMPPASDWVFCADQGDACSFNGLKTVRYGADGKWVYRTTTGSLDCVNESFVQDPVRMTAKQCFVATPTTTSADRVPVTAAYCHDDNCERGISEAMIRVVPVNNPLGVSKTFSQGVVPAFVITARTPSSEGPLSIETTNIVTFSNNVQVPPYGDFQFALRDAESEVVIDPVSGSLSVEDNVITYPVLLEENREYRFTVTEELRDEFGKPLQNPGSFSYTTVQMDKLYYYRLTSQFSDPLGRSLAINPADSTCLMAPTDTSDFQQQWFVEPYDESAPGLDTRLSPDTKVRLRNRFYGSARNLEAAAPMGPCQMNLASTNVFSGEEWYSAFRFDQVGFFWLHVEDAYALDQPGGGTIAGQAETGDFSGQAWFVTRLGRR